MAVDVRANVTKTFVAADIILMSGKNFVHILHNLEILRIGSFHFANAENQGKKEWIIFESERAGKRKI